jgi:hypothetical protein
MPVELTCRTWGRRRGAWRSHVSSEFLLEHSDGTHEFDTAAIAAVKLILMAIGMRGGGGGTHFEALAIASAELGMLDAVAAFHNGCNGCKWPTGTRASRYTSPRSNASSLSCVRLVASPSAPWAAVCANDARRYLPARGTFRSSEWVAVPRGLHPLRPNSTAGRRALSPVHERAASKGSHVRTCARRALCAVLHTHSVNARASMASVV